MVSVRQDSVIVDSVMSRKPVLVPSDATVQEAARRMREHHVGSILIGSAVKPIGILTESDFVRLVAEGADPAMVVVREVMSSPVITIEATAQLEDAAERMRKRKVKRLVVVVGDEVRGVVTVRDIAYAMPESGKRFLDAVRARWDD
ncbi:MAG: CBS domain-containing protein [Euryarchaeota archaeon]|nr:CBS domain-containing protein [Euryarchaeota archaeon]